MNPLALAMGSVKWSPGHSDDSLAVELDEWLEKHSHQKNQWGVEKGAPFSLKYEIEPTEAPPG